MCGWETTFIVLLLCVPANEIITCVVPANTLTMVLEQNEAIFVPYSFALSVCLLYIVALWCGVVWCGVPKALLPKGKGRDVYPRVQVNGQGCVCCVRAVCKCVVA